MAEVDQRYPAPWVSEGYALDHLNVRYGTIQLTPAGSKEKAQTHALKAIAEGMTTARTFALNLLFLLLLLLLGGLIWDEIHRSHVVIESIYIPGPLKDRGYSEQIAAYQLRDAINTIQEKSDTQKQRVTFAPDTGGIEIVIPELGISLKSFVQFVRRVLGFEHDDDLRRVYVHRNSMLRGKRRTAASH